MIGYFITEKVFRLKAKNTGDFLIFDREDWERLREVDLYVYKCKVYFRTGKPLGMDSRGVWFDFRRGESGDVRQNVAPLNF